MESILPIKNDPSDGDKISVKAFSAGTDNDLLAEKLSRLMPSIISKIVQRELEKELQIASLK